MSDILDFIFNDSSIFNSLTVIYERVQFFISDSQSERRYNSKIISQVIFIRSYFATDYRRSDGKSLDPHDATPSRESKSNETNTTTNSSTFLLISILMENND